MDRLSIVVVSLSVSEVDRTGDGVEIKPGEEVVVTKTTVELVVTDSKDEDSTRVIRMELAL